MKLRRSLILMVFKFLVTITPSTSKMIERIMANDDVFYRHEQRDAPDLTLQEKRFEFLALFMIETHLLYDNCVQFNFLLFCY